MNVLFNLVLPMTGLVAAVIILIACIIFWMRMRTRDTLLMMVARVVSLAVAVSRAILAMAMRVTSIPPSVLVVLHCTVAVVSLAALLVFAFALLHVAQSVATDT